MEYVKVSITRTGASLFSSKYSVFDEETKTFPSLDEAKTYLKATYKGHRRSPTYVDKADGTTVQTGYVYSYRNVDWSHSQVETWNQQDWVDVTTVVETPIAVLRGIDHPMAATIGRVQGFTKAGAPKNTEATRLGGGSIRAQAATWHTFADVAMNADGTGYLTVKRDGQVIHQLSWDKE